MAGADDLGAIAYNPAGIFDAGEGFLADGGWVDFQSYFTRQLDVTQVDPNTGAPVATYRQTFETARGGTPFLPIPTLVGAFRPHDQWLVALGVYAPYAALSSWAESTPTGKPAPQRYSVYSLEGSALAVASATVAFAPSPEWRIGLSAGVLAGSFQTRSALSACIPDRFLCAAEDPDWDVEAELQAVPIVAPHGSLGVTWQPTPLLRLGLSGTAPVWVQSAATLKTRLPASPIFANASTEGEAAEVRFWLPPVLRAGVEVRPVRELRVELAGGVEFWSLHNQIEVNPLGVVLRDVTLLPATYAVPRVIMPRGFQDSASVKLGGEYEIDAGKVRITPRAGVGFESSAVPNGYVSALTPDADKVTTALGVGVTYDRLRFDVAYARVFYFDQAVDPANARLTALSPVEANPPASPVPINAGVYTSDVNVVAVGLSYQLSPPPKAWSAPAQATSAPSPPPVAKPPEPPVPQPPAAVEPAPAEPAPEPTKPPKPTKPAGPAKSPGKPPAKKPASR